MEKPAKSRSRLRRCLGWLGRGFLILLLLLALFHRPLVFEGTRYFVVRAAKQQNLDLSYDISGSIFTSLRISNLKAVPTESGPIQRLDIDELALEYSLTGLVRYGLSGLLKSVTLRNTFLEMTPAEPAPPEKDREPQKFKFPALFPERLELENINVLIHTVPQDTTLEGLVFTLLPDRPGVLEIKVLDIPGIRRWTDISAATTFRNRNLLLEHLAIGPEIALREFNLDASQLDDARLGLGLDGTFFNAPVRLKVDIADLNGRNALNAHASISNLSFDSVLNYFAAAVPLQGGIETLSLSFQGEPENPAAWTGTLDAKLTDLVFDGSILGSLDASVSLKDGKAHVLAVDQLTAENSVRLQAQGDLPQKSVDFPKMPATGQLDVQLPRLDALSIPLEGGLDGDLSLQADFALAEGKLTADMRLASAKLFTTGVETSEFKATAQGEKTLDTQEGAPVFEGLSLRVEAGIAGLRYQDYAVENVRLAATAKDAAVSMESLSLSKEANTLSLAAKYTLPADMESFADQPLDFHFSLKAPELKAFLAEGAAMDLAGTLEATGNGTFIDRVGNGSVKVAARDLSIRDLKVRSADLQLDVVDNDARLSALDVILNDENRMRGGGEMQLKPPFVYQGWLDAGFKNLAVFEPLLQGPVDKTSLGGALTASWKGRGEGGMDPGKSRPPQHEGEVTIQLTGGQYGELKNLEARAAANYSPREITAPEISLSAGELGEATLGLFWKENRLTIPRLVVQQKKLTLLEGNMDLPLRLGELGNIERLLPGDEPLKVALNTKSLDLGSLLDQLGQKEPSVTGRLDGALTVDGTLNALKANMQLHARNLRAASAAELDPAEVILNAGLNENRLSVNGTVSQKLIRPLQISGGMAMPAADLLRGKPLDPETPIDLRINMPSSSIAFVPTLAPAIRLARGMLGMDVRAAGTLSKPQLSGTVTGNISALRFADPSLPPINDFDLQIDLTPERIRIARCRGGLAGGQFEAGGDIGITNFANPEFALRVTTRNALALQNDDLTVRFSSDLRVNGPLSGAAVTGEILVTRSKFFKNIDILPIGLPGRPAPQPPENPGVISFPDPPLRDWKFDVAIRTADPFLIRSNLATGKLTMDLNLGGTGLKPWLDGSVVIENLTASLPFSQLNIESGFVYFSKAEPFLPRLNIHGTSTIRDYNVNVYIYGSASDPQAVFQSEPPLPQAEVVSLIATGMTTKEISSDPNALAGRAAVLVFQKLYRSIFQRNRPPEARDNTFLGRMQLDLGGVDPKTGKQSALARLPLTRNITLAGGVDVGGNFRGEVKYIIRFK